MRKERKERTKRIRHLYSAIKEHLAICSLRSEGHGGIYAERAERADEAD
jgi:hypothetical protein